MQNNTRGFTLPPADWELTHVGHVADIIGGSTPSKTRQEYWDGDIPWVVPSEISALPGRWLAATDASITTRGMKAAGLRLIPGGSVLLTTRATIGLTAINKIPVTTNQGFKSLVPKDGVDPIWLYYCISTRRRELRRRAAGSTFLEVSGASLRSLPIILPPLCEQQAIARVLSSVDEVIERTDELITTAEQIRDSIRQELLARGIPGLRSEWKNAPGFEPIPAAWQVTQLADIAYPRTETWKPNKEDTRPYIGLAHIQPGRITGQATAGEAASHKAVFYAGDMLYGRLRPNLRKGMPCRLRRSMLHGHFSTVRQAQL